VDMSLTCRRRGADRTRRRRTKTNKSRGWWWCGASDRTTNGLQRRVGRVGARGCASRVETASLPLVIARHEAWVEARETHWWVVARSGERCDPLARSDSRAASHGISSIGGGQHRLGDAALPRFVSLERRALTCERVAEHAGSGGGGQHGDPHLCGSAAVCLAGFAAQSSGVFENAERALDLAPFLVAAVLFPDPLCGRRRRRPTMTGANGQVVAFSGT
jgi:hypothetical protein